MVLPPRPGVTYLIKAILHNNLAGLGPDRGEEEMQFLVSQERHGADTQDIKAGPDFLARHTEVLRMEVSENGDITKMMIKP